MFGGVYHQTCRQCRDPEDGQKLRREWGCDEPTERKQDRIGFECFACAGEKPECPHCDSDGRMHLRRCPNSLDLEREREVVRLCAMVESGFLPTTGGMLEQTASFVQSLDIVQREIHRLQNERRKDADKKRKRQQRSQKRRGYS